MYSDPAHNADDNAETVLYQNYQRNRCKKWLRGYQRKKEKSFIDPYCMYTEMILKNIAVLTN